MTSTLPTMNSTPSSTSTTPVTTAVSSSGTWQAIFSPQYNTYYFYNSETQETTWENPLVQGETGGPVTTAATEIEQTSSTSPETATNDEKDSPSTSAIPSFNALQQAAIAQGIDPSLAYLDPSLAATSSTSALPGSYTAKFNARTGQFARADARDPSHLSEYERAKRMSEFYFDVGAWERQKEQEKKEEEEAAAAGKKRKRPTKKDLERFKEQKRLKKIAKTAWLRT